MKHDEKETVIVSLTSFPGRIGTVHKTIETLLNQTRKPDKLILWLTEEEFPNREDGLPEDLLEQKRRGLEIRWYHNIRSYTKLIPTLRMFPDAVIVTADDDIYYHPQWLERLFRAYQRNANVVWCHRATKVSVAEDGSFVIWPYTVDTDPLHKPSYLRIPTGVGGILYPPHCLYPDVLDEAKFMSLAPTNDDIWFWLMAVLAGFRISSPKKALVDLHYIEGTQEVGLWCTVNNLGETYLPQFQHILHAYPQLGPRLRSAAQEKSMTEKILRKLYGGVQCYRDHGFGQTLRRALYHLGLRKEKRS